MRVYENEKCFLDTLYANIHLEREKIIEKSDRYNMYLIWQEERDRNKLNCVTEHLWLK